MEDIRKGRCPLCLNTEIIEARPPNSEHGAMQSQWVRHVDIQGQLWAFVCRSCGYAQWFAAMPDKIPVGDAYRTRLLPSVRPAGPYR